MHNYLKYFKKQRTPSFFFIIIKIDIALKEGNPKLSTYPCKIKTHIIQNDELFLNLMKGAYIDFRI